MEVEPVRDVFLLSERQTERIQPFFPLVHAVPRVDDRRVLNRMRAQVLYPQLPAERWILHVGFRETLPTACVCPT